MFRVGIIGLGFIAQNHLEGFNGIPGVEITAVCDVNYDRVKTCLEKFPIKKGFYNYMDLLQCKGLDLVVICVPNFLHSKIAVDALNAGHHVLCEKPMATTLADAKKMLIASKANSKTLSIVMNFRWQFFGPDAFHLRQLIGDGKFGRIFYVRARYLRQKTFPESGSSRWNLKRDQSGGGVLIDLGPHMLDLAMWLVDDYAVRSVTGFTYNGQLKNSNVDDFASAALFLSSGIRLTTELAWNSNNESAWQIDIYGERGGAVLRQDQPPGRRITCFSRIGDEALTRKIELGDGHPVNDPSIHQHVFLRMSAGDEPDCTGERGLKVMEAIDAWYKSDRENREVVLGIKH